MRWLGRPAGRGKEGARMRGRGDERGAEAPPPTPPPTHPAGFDPDGHRPGGGLTVPLFRAPEAVFPGLEAC